MAEVVTCPIDGVVFEASFPRAVYCSPRCRMREPRLCAGPACEVWFIPTRDDQCRRAAYWKQERK